MYCSVDGVNVCAPFSLSSSSSASSSQSYIHLYMHLHNQIGTTISHFQFAVFFTRPVVPFFCLSLIQCLSQCLTIGTVGAHCRTPLPIPFICLVFTFSFFCRLCSSCLMWSCLFDYHQFIHSFILILIFIHFRVWHSLSFFSTFALPFVVLQCIFSFHLPTLPTLHISPLSTARYLVE